ncbi:DNA-binding response regulator [Enterobacter asburiae]|uniref:DNA-binding response regulator n=1 Tax=Enterobacter asburiae TaxID=61645 RepID=UPI00287D402C|nr:DNA-binding response regulator [Enterobacter asburiae]
MEHIDHILVVDDDRDIRELIVDYLVKSGYRATGAANGKEMRVVLEEGVIVALSGAEYRLLRVFLDHPQRVLTRDQLLNLTQGRDAELFERSIDLLVSRVRQRLNEDARTPAYIKTVRSEGYVFTMPVTIKEANE